MKQKRMGLGFLGLLICAGLAVGCDRANQVNAAANAPDAPTVPVVKVVRRDFSNDLEIASEFQPFQEIDVYAKVSGYIQHLYVDWGTHVRQGQILADLEIPELEQQLQEDEASLSRSQSDLQRAREELNQANSAYKVAHLTYTRLQGVQETRPGLISQEDIDVAEGKDQETSSGVSGAKDALAAAEEGAEAAKANLAKDTALFAYSHITAPFDGVVTQMNAYTGALLPSGTSSNIGNSALCHLSQNNILRLVIPVPEQAVPDIRLGEVIAVNVSALGKTFNGKIVRVAGQINMETRTMHTEVQVPNPNYELVPGMYASVRIPLHTAANVLAVPLQAVQMSTAGKGTVLVVNGHDKLEARNVTLGLQSAADDEILSGVRENELVVFGETGQYRSGQLVSPKLVQPPSQQE